MFGLVFVARAKEFKILVFTSNTDVCQAFVMIYRLPLLVV